MEIDSEIKVEKEVSDMPVKAKAKPSCSPVKSTNPSTNTKQNQNWKWRWRCLASKRSLSSKHQQFQHWLVALWINWEWQASPHLWVPHGPAHSCQPCMTSLATQGIPSLTSQRASKLFKIYRMQLILPGQVLTIKFSGQTLLVLRWVDTLNTSGYWLFIVVNSHRLLIASIKSKPGLTPKLSSLLMASLRGQTTWIIPMQLPDMHSGQFEVTALAYTWHLLLSIAPWNQVILLTL